MFSSIGRRTVSLSTGRLYQSRFIGFSLATTAFAGSATVAKCQGLDSNDSGSLFLPTLEAGVRAMRLVKTAVQIVIDYEAAKFKNRAQGKDEEEIELSRLEAEVEAREMELEQAQMEYAGKSGEQLNDLSAEDRKRVKERQKMQMQDAANKLANAEAALASMEGVSSKSKLHKKAAKRLLELCRQNGGVYIKIGQHLANLDYLIPPEYIEVLSSLFDEAPQSNYENVCRVIEEELNGKVHQLFDNFEKIPIASASLAQVHVAYDKETGKKLAIKVQHAGLRETSAGDMFAVTSVVGVIDRLFDDFTFGWIADEIAPHLPKELDFRLEGKNSERAAAHIQKTGLECVVPKVIWEKTAARVLTMEFEEGFKSTDLKEIEKSGLCKQEIAKLISSVFNSQVFASSFVHCDPHPANVLLRNKNGKAQLVLLDHGLYKEIDDNFRIKYAQLWKSLMLADLDGIEKACRGMGIDNAYPLFAAMLTARPYDEIIERSKTGSFASSTAAPESQADKAVIRGYAKQFLSEIFALLGILPRQMLLLLKMNDCLRHIDFALGSPTNTLVVAGKYASRAVYEHDMKNDGSIGSRFRHWLDYMKVLFRIQIYDFGYWLLHK